MLDWRCARGKRKKYKTREMKLVGREEKSWLRRRIIRRSWLVEKKRVGSAKED